MSKAAKLSWFLLGVVASFYWLAFSTSGQNGLAVFVLFIAVIAFAIAMPAPRRRPPDEDDPPSN